MHIYRFGYISQTDTQSTHMKTSSTNGVILLPSLTEQDRFPKVKKYVYAYVQARSTRQLGSDIQPAQ